MLVSKLLAATMIAGAAGAAESPKNRAAGVATVPSGGRPARGTGGLLRSRGMAGLAARRGSAVHLRHISK
jgi:hypothetical protein